MSSPAPYQNRLRVRVAGLLAENDQILLVQIHSPVSDELVWIPPGGGVEFGESLSDALRREFSEETGLNVKVGELMYINELLEDPYHALEFFFSVARESGELKLGTDPEQGDQQLLKDISFFEKQELQEINISPAYLAKEFWLGKRIENFKSSSADHLSEG